MSPIKTLARESYFLASIFSKTLFSLFKTLGQQLVVLVILEILRLFWLIKRFRGVFFLHFFFGILETLVILDVFGLFWSF